MRRWHRHVWPSLHFFLPKTSQMSLTTALLASPFHLVTFNNMPSVEVRGRQVGSSQALPRAWEKHHWSCSSCVLPLPPPTDEKSQGGDSFWGVGSPDYPERKEGERVKPNLPDPTHASLKGPSARASGEDGGQLDSSPKD